MDFGSKRKADPSFSMASMTDIIFLLLVFFMLTSNFVTPSGLPVNLPSSKQSQIVMQKVTVTVSKDLRIFVNDKETNQAALESVLQTALGGPDGSVVLHIDKDVPVEQLVKVAGIATKLKAKVTLATSPETK